jgi:hypothetical protein
MVNGNEIFVDKYRNVTHGKANIVLLHQDVHARHKALKIRICKHLEKESRL